MRIYIVRHGEAELAALGSSDAGRQLTARGQRQAARVGAALRVLGEVPAVVLTSPVPRARQTAELAVKAMADKRSRPPIRVLDRLAPGAYAGDVLAAIPADPQSVMLVGHQPTLGALVGALIGGLHAAPHRPVDRLAGLRGDPRCSVPGRRRAGVLPAARHHLGPRQECLRCGAGELGSCRWGCG